MSPIFPVFWIWEILSFAMAACLFAIFIYLLFHYDGFGGNAMGDGQRALSIAALQDSAFGRIVHHHSDERCHILPCFFGNWAAQVALHAEASPTVGGGAHRWC